MALQLVITNAGRAAVIDQANGGFRSVRIASVGVSPNALAAAATAATLPGEVKRIASIAGEATATDVVHLTVTDESAASYSVRSFALYLSDGTLFALYGQNDVIVEKSAQALLLLAIDVTLAAIPAAAITFGNANFTNPAATTSRAGVIEIADDAEELAATDRSRALTPRSLNRAIRRNVGGRPIDYDSNAGALTIRGDTGAWALGYFFVTSDGSPLGGFGALGSGNILPTYYFIGNRYDSTNNLRVYSTRVSYGDSTIWHAGNDGAGSGLDADLLDGRHATSFLIRGEGGRPLDYDAGAGSMTIRGDAGAWAPGYFFLTSDGSPLGGFGALGSGNVLPTYYFIGNRYDSANNLRVYPTRVSYGDNTIWHAGNDGAGSGLDADLLDGWDRDTVRDWNNLLNRPASIWHAANDGSGSGLDADLLDGRHATSFLIRGEGGRPLDYDAGAGSMTIRGDAGAWALGYYFLTSDGSPLGGFGALGSGNVLPTYYFIGNRYDAVNNLRVYPTRVSYGDNTIWHAGNDGAGSGLDADLLDGRQGSEFALLSGASFSGPVSGQTPGDGSTGGIRLRGAASSNAAYMQVLDPAGTSQWGYLGFAPGGVFNWTGQQVWHAGNDGAGSGLDADLVDGWQKDAIRDWNNLLNRPGAFPPAAHTHSAADIAAAFPASMSTNGYTILPNGLVLQWMNVGAGNGEGAFGVTWPIAFPNACFNVCVGVQISSVELDADVDFQLVGEASTTGATLMRQRVGDWKSSISASARLIAIGY